MMKTIVLALACVALAYAALPRTEEQWKDAFLGFMKTYNKQYNSSEEYWMRLNVFKKNVHVAEWRQNKDPSAKHGVTQFSDLTAAEFKAFLGYKKTSKTPAPENRQYIRADPNFEAPSSIDWRDKGAVTPVKDQGQCGSCWAFSTTEEIESQWFMAGHSIPTLAPQQIVDCDTTDQGCNGGDPPTAYAYVIQAGGMESESNYPYTGEDGSCQADTADFIVTMTGWKYACKDGNEQEMLTNVASLGPLSICVDASSWSSYSGGVMTSCGQSLDHCVQLVGYGTDSGQDYWLVRNSWGTSWGESGYIRLLRNQNTCGIADEVTYASISTIHTSGGSGSSSTSNDSSDSSTSSTSDNSSTSSSSGVAAGVDVFADGGYGNAPSQ